MAKISDLTLPLFIMALSVLPSRNARAQSLDDEPQGPREIVSFYFGGGFPNRFNFDLHARLYRGLHIGVALQGTDLSVEGASDAERSNINTIDLMLSYEVTNGNELWRKVLQGSGIIGYMGGCYVDRYYGDLPYHYGAAVTIAASVSPIKNVWTGAYVRPSISCIRAGRDQHGTTYAPIGFETRQLLFGARIAYYISRRLKKSLALASPREFFVT